MKRVVQAELLDNPDEPRPDVERSLRDLRRFNRYLRGNSIYRKLLGSVGSVRSVVDIGAATADNLLATSARLRVAVDFKIEHLLYDRDPRVKRVAGDALRLPFRTASVDAVTSALFFHHFEPEQNVNILTESLRVARKAVVVNDLARHVIPFLFLRLIGVLRLVGRITRFDAPASVRRAYTADELRAIAERAGNAEIRRIWPYRLGLILWK